jgi:threonine aldolase
LEAIKSVAAAGRRHDLALHLDGARLWHATAATGISEAEYAEPFDTVSVCISKALGAPVGSCLVGTKDFISRARRFKQQFGGGFRQAGIIAAGALYAVKKHRPRLVETHFLASRFAQGLAQIEGIEIDPSTVETNIVRYRLPGVSAGRFVDEAHRRGLWMLPSGADAVRAVFYLDITADDVDAALKIIAGSLRTLPKDKDAPRATTVRSGSY